MESTIRLFKSVPIDSHGSKSKGSKSLNTLTMKRGFVFSPEVIAQYGEKGCTQLIGAVSNCFGIDSTSLNSSFHKSWKKVRDSKIEDLVIEQILHYITTYGFEALGVYDESTVFIPTEKLQIPKLDVDKFNFVVIKGYTKKELKSKLIKLLDMGVALKDKTKNAVVDIATFVDMNEDEVCSIKNKEVRVCMYEYMGLIPKDPIEFLRFLIYKATNKTLIIKNGFTISQIKANDGLAILRLFNVYEQKHGLEKLASIFFRFKPLFLAFRSNKKLRVTINKIRRLADTHHVAMKEDFLNNVTSTISQGEKLSDDKLEDELGKVNTFRKIRLAYALKYRTDANASIMYRVRNGKSFATEFEFSKKKEASRVLGLVVNSITKDVKPNVKGKRIYIPKTIQYSLPATEKQFTGDFPSGTCVSVPKDMIIGVHWFNTENRVDLDLSMINCTAGKIGWDSHYRTSDRGILFSGDVTDAPKPNGASELFYIKKQENAAYILMLNHYNHFSSEEGPEVPFKLVIGSELVKNFGKNYMLDPNRVVTTCQSTITDKQKVLGLIVTTPEECKFYFAESIIGDSITASGNEYIEHSRKYLFNFYENSISLEDILRKAGAEITDKKQDKCDIDLSPENIQRDTILSLLCKN